MLSPAERALLLKYLLDYKNGCEQRCFPQDFSPSDEETVVTAPAAKSAMNYDAADFVEIGGSKFPALTEQVLSQPYLALPTTLTSKQRRVIHELCVDGTFALHDVSVARMSLCFSFDCMFRSRHLSLWCWSNA